MLNKNAFHNLGQGWPTLDMHATVWHSGVSIVAREDLLKILLKELFRNLHDLISLCSRQNLIEGILFFSIKKEGFFNLFNISMQSHNNFSSYRKPMPYIASLPSLDNNPRKITLKLSFHIRLHIEIHFWNPHYTLMTFFWKKSPI